MASTVCRGGWSSPARWLLVLAVLAGIFGLKVHHSHRAGDRSPPAAPDAVGAASPAGRPWTGNRAGCPRAGGDDRARSRRRRGVTDRSGPTGSSGNSVRSFSTLRPDHTTSLSFYPGPSLKTIGVGQPLVVTFDSPPTDRAAAEKALTVTTVLTVAGSWYWIDRTTVLYRPKDFWKAGSRITVAARIFGVDLGDGMYGEGDRTLNVTVGQSRVAKIDDATKQMRVFIDGKLVRTVPVSLVRDDKNIPLAVRLCDEGIFVHSAPWSVDDQVSEMSRTAASTSIPRQPDGSTTISASATSSR